MTVTIYHNARCSKSRQTLQLLRDRGIEPEIVAYLDTPPTPEELDALCTAMGKQPQEITRTKETLFTELNLHRDDSRTRAEWLRILADNPRLIERPIVACNGRAAVGRPPEAVLAVLEA